MRYFLDAEFMEYGMDRPIDLISIGIVCEDGREFYAEVIDAPLHQANAFVREYVLPHLRGPKLSRKEIRFRLLYFLDPEQHGTPEFWGYYADYDWVIFCQLFGTMSDLPKGYPMYCRDIKQYCDYLGNIDLPKQGHSEHHALEDARWNGRAHTFLREYERSPKTTEVPVRESN